jgi:hypothetical protein
VATRHVKPILLKKTAVDRFNDNRQEESRRLNLKRKMEHDEKMATIRLKRHKYDLRYGSTPQTPDYSTPALAATAAVTSKEDKQIEILHLQIRLAELTRDNSAYASSSRCTSSSQMPHASSSHSLSLEDASTPSTGSGMSSLSYFNGRHHNGFVNSDNNFTSEDPGHYHASDGEADTTSWPETYNFAE